MLHENASVKKIKNEQIIFLCLIKLDSLNRKIYLHYCLWYYKGNEFGYSTSQRARNP